MKCVSVSVPTYALKSQAGGGMLTIVATLGVLLMLVQGTLYYKAKGSARFMGREKSKVLAQQISEAGVEDNIADLGRRTLKIRPGMPDTVTYSDKAFGGGSYTTRLTHVAAGAAADTIDLTSTGTVGRGSQTVRARMKLRKLIDTTRTPRITVAPETSYTYFSRTAVDTVSDTVQFDPNSLPAVKDQAAYTACMASAGKFCDLCHLPPGNPSHVIPQTHNKNSGAFKAHLDHHGDYITTDNTCDLYEPRVTVTIARRTVTDSTRSIVDRTIYDTTVVIDTMVKVQILSWR